MTSLKTAAKETIAGVFSAILLFVPSPVRAETGYAYSDIQPMRMRSETLYPRVSRFPFRWIRVTRALGTRLDTLQIKFD